MLCLLAGASDFIEDTEKALRGTRVRSARALRAAPDSESNDLQADALVDLSSYLSDGFANPLLATPELLGTVVPAPDWLPVGPLERPAVRQSYLAFAVQGRSPPLHQKL